MRDLSPSLDGLCRVGRRTNERIRPIGIVDFVDHWERRVEEVFLDCSIQLS